jgi:pimeloyl-ACP methyl ester carboxylesterase
MDAAFTGEPVVFVHGGLTSTSDWRDECAMLACAQQFQILLEPFGTRCDDRAHAPAHSADSGDAVAVIGSTAANASRPSVGSGARPVHCTR